MSRTIGSLTLLALAACGDPAPAGDPAGASVSPAGAADAGAAEGPAGADHRAALPAAPAPKVVRLAALQARLAELEGTPVLLNFWATWCAPCVAELPHLEEVWAERAADGLTVLTVSYDYMVAGVEEADALRKVAAHLERSGQRFEVLVYDEDDYDAINELLDLPGPIPVTLALGRDGKEVARVDGGTDLAGFRALAAAALGETATSD